MWKVAIINGGFSSIFGRLKVWICKIMAYEEWSIINWCMNGVHEWDWVHERCLCPRAAPSGINNRSCTQSHSWTPNSLTYPLSEITLEGVFILLEWIGSSFWKSDPQIFSKGVKRANFHPLTLKELSFWNVYALYVFCFVLFVCSF